MKSVFISPWYPFGVHIGTQQSSLGHRTQEQARGTGCSGGWCRFNTWGHWLCPGARWGILPQGEDSPAACGQPSCCSPECGQQGPHPITTQWYYVPLSWSPPCLPVLEVLPRYSGCCCREIGFSSSVLDSVHTRDVFSTTKCWSLSLGSLNFYKVSHLWLSAQVSALQDFPYGLQRVWGPFSSSRWFCSPSPGLSAYYLTRR